MSWYREVQRNYLGVLKNFTGFSALLVIGKLTKVPLVPLIGAIVPLAFAAAGDDKYSPDPKAAAL